MKNVTDFDELFENVEKFFIGVQILDFTNLKQTVCN